MYFIEYFCGVCHELYTIHELIRQRKREGEGEEIKKPDRRVVKTPGIPSLVQLEQIRTKVSGIRCLTYLNISN